MLDSLRRSASGLVAKILLGLLAVSFVGWGIADVIGNPSGGSTVLTAGETRVDVPQYQTAYRLGLDQVARSLQRRPTPQEGEALGVDQAVLSQLASGALLDEQARLDGVNVSDEGLIALIQEEPAFRGQSGGFSRDVMRATLQNAGLTEAGYLADLANSARRTQIVAAVSDGASVPDVFADAFGAYRGERRTVSYLTLAPGGTDTIANPSADELDDFFTERRDDYRAPEYRSFSYVLLSPADLARPGDVAPEQIATYYEGNQAQFTTPERRQVRQVVFADRAAADAAASAIATGSTLDAAASAAGATVADLGAIPRSAIPNASLAEAAFSTGVGRTSGVVDGPFGPVILEVVRIEPAVVRPLDAVRDQIAQTLAADAANAQVSAGYNAMQDALDGGATLEEAAQQSSLPLLTSPSTDRTGLDPSGNALPDLTNRTDVLNAAFSADPNAPVEPVSIGANGYVYVQVGEVTEPRDRELAEVEARVIQTWKEDEAQRLLEERAAALAERVRTGETVAGVGAAEGLSVSVAPAITRQTAPNEIGEAATRAAFSGAVGTVASAPARVSGQAVVLRVDEVAPPADPAAEVPPTARDGFNGTLREDLFQSYVARVEAQIPVGYNMSAIQQAKSGMR